MAQARRGPMARVARKAGPGGSGRALAALVALALVALVAGWAWAQWGGTGGATVTVERPSQGEGAAGAEGGQAEPGSDPEPETETEAEPEPTPATILVHVDGAVLAPGVYELAEGARANDAVRAAGGLSEGADTASLNLAAPLSDGEKVHVPREGEAAPAASGAGTGTGGSGSQGGLVNLNTATAEELCELPGIGEATAEAIVRDREANGPFASVEDLMRVSGIGEKKLARLEGSVCV